MRGFSFLSLQKWYNIYMKRYFVGTLQLIFLSGFFLFSIHTVKAEASLVGYWKFDETSPGNAVDSSGHGTDAIPFGGPVPTSTTPPAITFPNPASIYLTGADYFVIDRPVEDSFSICTWAKTSSVGNSSEHWLLAEILDSEVPTLASDFGFGIDNFGTLGYGNGGTFDATVNGNTFVSDDNWHHLCVTRNQSSGQVILYVDGAVDAVGATDTATLNDDSEAVIGAGTDGGGVITGFLDDFRIYNRVLTHDEISALYAGDEYLPIIVTDDAHATRKATIEKWKAKITETKTSCPAKLKLTVTGKHFDDDAEVFLGSHKASSVDVQSSKKLKANFCLPKLLARTKNLEKNILVKNPDTKAREANKKLDLSLYQTSFMGEAAYNQNTRAGILAIQKLLVHIKLLKKSDISGIYDQKTQIAVKTFQVQRGILQTGNVGPQTRAAFVAVEK